MAIPEADVAAYLDALPGLDVLRAKTTTFYYYDPKRDLPHDRRQPFATLVGDDDWDTVSDLARPGVYRLNLGVARETYRALFGPEPPWGPGGGPVETGHDWRQLDTFLPHPIYAPMSWLCILSPSEATWPRVQAYAQEAHALAAQAYARRRGA